MTPGCCEAGWAEVQNAALERFVNGCRPTAPTLILPVDQAEELFGADVGAEADEFLTVVSELLKGATPDSPIMAVCTIRSDRYELFQTAPQRVGLEAYAFEDLRPMPPNRSVRSSAGRSHARRPPATNCSGRPRSSNASYRPATRVLTRCRCCR